MKILNLFLSAAALAGVLRDKDVEMRRAAAVTLGQLGYKVQEAWPALKEAYGDQDNAVRGYVIRVLGRIGKNQKEAVALLAEAAVKDANVENRLAALQELGQLEMAAQSALPTLERLAVEDSRGSIREAARNAMKKIKGE